MRLLSRMLVVLVVCLIASPLLAGPTQAQDEEPFISLSPTSGMPGEDVTVRGYNFDDEEDVDIYYYLNSDRTKVATDETDDDGDFRVTFTVPESYKGPHDVRVYIGGSYEAMDEFTVEPGLEVNPEEGPVDTTVTVEGHGFAEDEEDIELRYYPDGTHEVIEDDITADEDGSWETSFKIPPSSSGSHKIDAKGDDSSLTEVEDATFEVTPGITIDKSSGSVGDDITMTGSGFAADERDITILFDGEVVDTDTDIRADDTGYWQESFDVPEMPKGTYSVTAEGEWTDEEDITALSFEIEPGLVLSPSQGHVDTNLTVTGQGFAADKNVVIRYDGSQQATARSNTKGSFEVRFLVPESEHGGRQVTAEVDGIVETTAIFTMESTSPDTPDLTSPPDGGRVGFIGSVTPTFEWSEVSDASGVYYSLQIATSDEVTANGEFVDPLVSKEGLVETSYTLEEAAALPYGTYYWIVQAVDGAENESGWTAAYSFRAGLLPLWAFIVIIVFIVLLIGALVYFFVIRKKVHYY